MDTRLDTEVRDDVGVVRIAGDLTPASEEGLSAAWGKASDDGGRAVVLDFSEMEYMNSGGIGLLVQLLVRANRTKHGLAAAGLSDHYRQIFQVTRLDEAIAIHDDVDAAVAAAG
jgi:anti-anti-sigma factor